MNTRRKTENQFKFYLVYYADLFGCVWQNGGFLLDVSVSACKEVSSLLTSSTEVSIHRIPYLCFVTVFVSQYKVKMKRRGDKTQP